MAVSSARARLPNVQWGRLLMLAGGTLLLALAIFGAWQTWLIADQGSAVEHVHIPHDVVAWTTSSRVTRRTHRIATYALSLLRTQGP